MDWVSSMSRLMVVSAGSASRSCISSAAEHRWPGWCPAVKAACIFVKHVWLAPVHRNVTSAITGTDDTGQTDITGEMPPCTYSLSTPVLTLLLQIAILPTAGVEQDIQAAMEWYEFAADGGLPAAQNNLGQLLLHGVTNVTNGAATDAAAAVQLFQAAADQGSSAASFNLGMCHELGLCGKGPDAAAAAECYQFAGSEKALLRLGHLRLMQQDKAAAKEAFTAAAEAGSAEALLQLAKLEAANCSDEQQQQTLLLPAPLGLTGSCGGVGSLSAGGTYSSLPVSSISKDYTSSAGSSSILAASSSLNSSCSSWAASARADAALTLYQKAAAAGIAEAQHTVGCVCWGKGLVADAMQAWHAAAGQGYGPALLCLAAAAEKGLQGVRKDCAAARACYAMAAACGCEEGAAQLVLLDQEAVLQNSSWHCLGAGA